MSATASAEPPPLPKGRRRHPSLIFEWVVSKGHRWRLLMFLNLSLALHVACFYAFQVVYPPTVRQRAQTTKVTFLDSRDPAVRDIVRRIEERAVFFDGSLRRTSPQIDSGEGEVLFVPGFMAHQPTLRFPPGAEPDDALPPVYSIGEIFLPPQSRLADGEAGKPPPIPAEKVFVYKPRVLLLGGLEGREVKAAPDWSGLQGAFAAAGNRLQFLVEVDRSGGLTSCLPWDGSEIAFGSAVARQLELGLRISPGEIVRGWIELRW